MYDKGALTVLFDRNSTAEDKKPYLINTKDASPKKGKANKKKKNKNKKKH